MHRSLFWVFRYFSCWDICLLLLCCDLAAVLFPAVESNYWEFGIWMCFCTSPWPQQDEASRTALRPWPQQDEASKTALRPWPQQDEASRTALWPWPQQDEASRTALRPWPQQDEASRTALRPWPQQDEASRTALSQPFKLGACVLCQVASVLSNSLQPHGL